MIRYEQALLDTCILVFLATGVQPATRTVERIASSGGVFVSPVSAWEVGLLTRPGRRLEHAFWPDPKTWMARMMSSRGFREAPLSFAIGIDSSRLPPPIHTDPADRLLIATARALKLPLLTSDRQILAYGEAGHVATIEA